MQNMEAVVETANWIEPWQAILIAAAAIVFIIIISNIHIVPQARAYVIERLGAYHATWGTGLHFKIPFIDKVDRKSVV